MSSKTEAAGDAKQKKYYYAVCTHHTHDHTPPKKTPWVSNYYETMTPAKNAQRMHNKMNPGHAAAVATMHK